MATTINEIIYKVRKGIRATSDDSKLTDRFIYAILKDKRSKYIRQELNKKRLFKSMEFQSLDCVDLTFVDASTCCNIKTGIKIQKSKIEIPEVIDTTNGLAISGVYSLDGQVRLNITTRNNFISKLSRKFKSNDNQAFFEGNTLYCMPVEQGAVKIMAIFENPEEVQVLNLKKCQKDDCSPKDDVCISYLDMEFPVPKYLEDTIVEDAINFLLQSYFKINPDRSNDSSDR